MIIELLEINLIKRSKQTIALITNCDLDKFKLLTKNLYSIKNEQDIINLLN